jgi:hypothetical protein
MTRPQIEGWYLDPFNVYELRWFSDGTPTSLVSDAGAESRGDPPSTTYSGELEPVPERPSDASEVLTASEDADRIDVGEKIVEVFEANGGD